MLIDYGISEGLFYLNETNFRFEQSFSVPEKTYLSKFSIYADFPVGGKVICHIADPATQQTLDTTTYISANAGLTYRDISFNNSPLMEVNKTYVFVIAFVNTGATLGRGLTGPNAWVATTNGSQQQLLPLAIRFEVEKFVSTKFINGQAPAVSAEQLNKLGSGIEMSLDSSNWIYNYGQYTMSVIVGANGGTGTASIAVNQARIFELYCTGYNGKSSTFYFDTKNQSQLLRIWKGADYSLFGNNGTENLLEGTVFNNSKEDVYFLRRIQYNAGTLTFTFLNNHTVDSEMGMHVIVRSMG